MKFKNKIVIVTGAASGIGKSCAILFAKEGANVVLVDKNEIKLNEVLNTCKQYSQNHLAIPADLSRDDEVNLVVDKTIECFSKLDVLVNNAGVIGRYASILDESIMGCYDEIMNVNLRALVVLTARAVPYLVQTKGNIVNTGSVGALKRPKDVDMTCYCISKAGVNHFTRCAALELAPTGVRVNCVNPGVTNTGILDTGDLSKDKAEEIMKYLVSETLLGKISEPEEVADLILYLASDTAKSITGSCFLIDNGILIK